MKLYTLSDTWHVCILDVDFVDENLLICLHGTVRLFCDVLAVQITGNCLLPPLLLTPCSSINHLPGRLKAKSRKTHPADIQP